MKPQEFYKNAADIFNERLNELGMSRYRFMMRNGVFHKNATYSRAFSGEEGYNVSTLIEIADLLGLDVVFKMKDNNESND